MRGPCLLMLLCSTALLGCGPRENAQDARPNLVLLIADDMDYEHFGFAGHPLARTPALDALAREGVVFRHGFVPMSRCRPAQAALLSGRWPHQNGIYFNTGPGHIDPAEALPNHLKRVGYATIGEGKFWEVDPQLMGFSNESIVNYETFVREGQEHLFRFLEEHAGRQPVFVWWAPELPHLPHDPPARLLEPFSRESIQVPPWLADDPVRSQKFRDKERASLAMGAWLDEGIGELLTKLRALDLYENTLFVFLIDNGWANGVVSKGWAFDKSLRTPVVFAWAGGIHGGRSLTDLVSVVDIYATLLDYAGAPVPPGCQGQSLRARLEGRAGTPREALYGALYPREPSTNESNPARDAYGLWARTGRWKYVLTLRDLSRSKDDRDDDRDDLKAVLVPSFERKRGDQELYDLASDPLERENLAARPENTALLSELRAGILDWWSSTGGAPLDLP